MALITPGMSALGAILGFLGVMAWRIREGRSAVTTRKILIPPAGMATGFSMFVVPAFRVPWAWAAAAFLIGALFLAETLLFLNMGPLNAAIVSVTRLETRSMAFAANILVIHLLGDAASPFLIGWGSDLFGLSRALMLACAALGVGGLLCFAARGSFGPDSARASGAPA